MATKLIKNQLKAQLRGFLSANAALQVVYTTSALPAVTSSTKRILILDSSFNPPHKGHYSLVEKSFKYKYHDLALDKDNSSVLLLLSIKNADKLTPKPAVFEDRLDMICLLADYIYGELGVTVSVALTSHAKFADKSLALQKWIGSELKELKLTFLVGFDTVVRIFDPKYYEPISLSAALDNFMKHNELFCLTRKDDKEYSLNDQLNYVEDIAEGVKYPSIPKEWSQFIYLDQGDEKALSISSSEIRTQVGASTKSWEPLVIDSISDYIKQHNIYKL